MIFRSGLGAQPSRGATRPAFEAIAEVQQHASAADWFVTQPDHARISGELAAAFDPGKVANLGDAVVRAIGLHDIGWTPCDGDFHTPHAPSVLPSGVAVSFVNASAQTFLPAWLGSIQAAQSAGPLGGLIVSAHFSRLAEVFLDSSRGTPEDHAHVAQFRQREAARAERLLPLTGMPPAAVEALVAVLQFCDLASLYLCANPAAAVEFPQQLGGSRVRFSVEDGACRIAPHLLCHALELEIPCVRFVDGKPQRETVSLILQ